MPPTSSSTRTYLITVINRRRSPLIYLSSIWEDSLILPPLIAAISLLAITIHYVSTRAFVKKIWTRFTKSPIEEVEVVEEPNTIMDHNGFFADLRHHAESLGGVDILAYRVLRLLSVFTLVGLSATAFVLDEPSSPSTTSRGKHWGKKHRHPRGGDTLTYSEWLDLAVSMTYVSYQHMITPNTR